eukprot:5923809-Amphidinium_carterae.1
MERCSFVASAERAAPSGPCSAPCGARRGWAAVKPASAAARLACLQLELYRLGSSLTQEKRTTCLTYRGVSRCCVVAVRQHVPMLTHTLVATCA